jgi:hypothetical protein
MIRTGCLSCEAELEIEQSPEVGQKISCPRCLATLEVIWLFPLTMDLMTESPTGEQHRTTSLVNS